MLSLQEVENLKKNAKAEKETSFIPQLARTLQPFFTYAQKTKIMEDDPQTVILQDGHSRATLTAKHFQALFALLEQPK